MLTSVAAEWRAIVLLFAYFAIRQMATALLSRGFSSPGVVRRRGNVVLAMLWIAFAMLLLLAGFSAALLPLGIVGRAGIGLLVAGTVLRLRALVALGPWYAPDVRLYEGQVLVRSGPYKHLRHPLYLGLSLEAVGLALLGRQWYLWVLALGVFTLAQIQNRYERQLLSAKFGNAYQRYERDTWDILDVIDLNRLRTRLRRRS